MEVTVLGKLIVVNPVQFSNTREPIFVSAPSLVPKSTFVNPVHPLNALESMLETVLGKLIVVIPVQFSNACKPIFVLAPALVPKSTLVNPVHPLNA